ncbi:MULTISPECIES: DUF2835 family protein [Pseudoalteromonas]|uniref:DUF2835 domain-containing protein n=2 Tax=Pseudoalteromonas TaxID=53246 RepID=V4HR84_PSEL2|nr:MULTISPECIES: DUF2835 family protein [Pseudoalteromonas]ESP93315.1 protein of unknown function (DUF2835) [Pseudoalteromonas luteoviolacea 2ta16]KZN32804.1 hypothetical protein N483_26465 [Pseudoalteromonas luteoviolacea NCIMB 1944]MBQ4838686.1 DUF2835 domain-containing protein [Pseudoalteromonas luteoviolacea]MCG7550252.1 DUF2835 domain-containing protein [Pseudoalteromonas sp. Of7M-16]MDK2593731.1 DUF2835 family protein [Pseudoalteromonas sp. P94(2023)]
MQEYYFFLRLTYEQCLAYYEGDIEYIQVVEDGGKRIRFPATHIRRFVSSIGVSGRFRLQLDDSNRFIALEKVT